MVELRSRRLESVFGTKLDQLSAEHVRGLVASNVQEAFDLDFKETLYGRGDSEKRSLAGDVAALANTAGGVIVLGVVEDEQARATSAPGVELSDGEVGRIRQVVASLAAPMPTFDVLTPADTSAAAVDPDNSTRQWGFIVIAVPRSPNAPHAVLVNDALRYPVRNGSTTRYLSEPEIANAYRDRFAGATRQAQRVEEIEADAIGRLDTSDSPWVVVSLVPDLAGDLVIGREMYRAFEQEIIGREAMILSSGVTFRRARVGRRRLLADGTMDRAQHARWVSLELHTDGAGVYAVPVVDLAARQHQGQPPASDQPQILVIHDESIALGILSGLVQLAGHARDRAAASGTALVRAQLVGISAERPVHIGHRRQFGGIRSMNPLVVDSPPAEAAAPLDDLAEPGPTPVATAALLYDELGQAFGIPEMGQLTRDGRLRHRYWAQPNTEIVDWAESHGIEVTDESLES